MADLGQHRVNIARALADKEQTQEELFNDLLAMQPDERAKLSPALFSRLTEAQLLMLLGGDPPIGASCMTSPASPVRSGNKCWRLTWPLLWLRPAWVGIAFGALVSTCTGLVTVGALKTYVALAERPASLVRSVHADLWPACPRLTSTTDGCVYHVQAGLTWNHAADLLHMPIATLANQNTRIAAHPTLTAGTTLVIWRGTGTLYR